MTDTYLYVTKYALTDGIWKVPIEQAEFGDSEGGYLYVGRHGGHWLPIQVKPTDWFRTLEDAQRRVDQLKEAKIRSLDRNLSKLKNYRPKVMRWSISGLQEEKP